MKKRIISFFIAIVMVISLIPPVEKQAQAADSSSSKITSVDYDCYVPRYGETFSENLYHSRVPEDANYSIEYYRVYDSNNELVSVRDYQYKQYEYYHLEITFRANDGYTFDSNCRISRAGARINPVNVRFYDRFMVVTTEAVRLYEYAQEISTVKYLGLKVPGFGNHPSTVKLEATDFKTNVSTARWQKETSEGVFEAMKSTDVFEKDGNYRLVILIQTRGTYIFADGPIKFFFDGLDASKYTYEIADRRLTSFTVYAYFNEIHDFKAKGLTNATCQVEDDVFYECAICGETRTVKECVPHDYVHKNDATYHQEECVYCGLVKGEKEAHSYDNNNRCTVCSYFKDNDAKIIRFTGLSEPVYGQAVDKSVYATMSTSEGIYNPKLVSATWSQNTSWMSSQGACYYNLSLTFTNTNSNGVKVEFPKSVESYELVDAGNYEDIYYKYNDDKSLMIRLAFFMPLPVEICNHGWFKDYVDLNNGMHSVFCEACRTYLNDEKHFAMCGEYRCGGCNTALEAPGHNWGLSGEKQATCTEAGFRELYCRICGERDYEELKALGHVDKNNDGICDRPNCGHEIFHTHNWVVETHEDGSCIQAESTWYGCTKCGERKEEVGKLGDHRYEPCNNRMEPSCTYDGHETDYRCQVCGNIKSGDIIPAYTAHVDVDNDGLCDRNDCRVEIAHKWAVSVEEIPASCENEGKKAVYECVHCAEKKGGETIAPLGHSFEFSSNGSVLIHFCKSCGFSREHEYRDGVCEICSFRCPHDNRENGRCLECGIGSTLELNKYEITIATKSTYNLKATISYGDQNQKVTWTTSDAKVATVSSSGVVTAKTYGVAIITATAEGGAKATCKVNTKFYDVNGSSNKSAANYQYYYTPVYWAAERGITKGNSDGSFGVGDNCKRESLMIFIWRTVGKPQPAKDAKLYFNDIPDKYGASTDTNKAIAWAYEQGISKGYNDGSFGFGKNIIRKDALIMLYRVAGKPSVSGTLKFSDCKSYKPGSDTYNAILWGSTNGITSGYKDGTFKPNDNCLREQIVTFLYRFTDRG